MEKKSIDEMNRQELERAYKIMIKRYESMIDANDALNSDNQILYKQIQTLEKQIIERDQKLVQNTQIIQDLITNQNKTKDDMVKEINLLREKLGS